MKTARRLTSTLIALLALYVFGYWFLIKNHWADKLLNDPADPFGQSKAMIAVTSIFQPIEEIDSILRIDIPLQKQLIGTWRSETNNDFVTIGPKQECQFQLGEYAFNGLAQYERGQGGLTAAFTHQDQTHEFSFSYVPFSASSGIVHLAFGSIFEISEEYSDDRLRHQSRLIKLPPSAPAP